MLDLRGINRWLLRRRNVFHPSTSAGRGSDERRCDVVEAIDLSPSSPTFTAGARVPQDECDRVAHRWHHPIRTIPAGPIRYWRTLTARAMTRPKMTSEMRACSAIVSFAHRASGIVSVGLNATAVVTPT